MSLDFVNLNSAAIASAIASGSDLSWVEHELSSLCWREEEFSGLRMDSELSSELYKEGVAVAKEQIVKGELSHLLLGLRFKYGIGAHLFNIYKYGTGPHPFDVYRALRSLIPSPYMTYYQVILVILFHFLHPPHSFYIFLIYIIIIFAHAQTGSCLVAASCPIILTRVKKVTNSIINSFIPPYIS